MSRAHRRPAASSAESDDPRRAQQQRARRGMQRIAPNGQIEGQRERVARRDGKTAGRVGRHGHSDCGRLTLGRAIPNVKPWLVDSRTSTPRPRPHGGRERASASRRESPSRAAGCSCTATRSSAAARRPRAQGRRARDRAPRGRDGGQAHQRADPARPPAAARRRRPRVHASMRATSSVGIEARVRTRARTGVEMEALTAVTRRRAHALRHAEGGRPRHGDGRVRAVGEARRPQWHLPPPRLSI